MGATASVHESKPDIAVLGLYCNAVLTPDMCNDFRILQHASSHLELYVRGG